MSAKTKNVLRIEVLNELVPKFTIISLALEGLIALSDGSVIEQVEVEAVANLFNTLKCQYRNILKDRIANP